MKKCIYRPCSTNRITQYFLENAACVTKYGKIVACRPGLESFYKSVGMNSHGAIDFALWHGEHLYFPVDLGIRWWVDKIGHPDERGLMLSVISDEKMVVVRDNEKVRDIRKPRDGETGEYIKFVFGHLMETPYRDGETIRFGQYLGRGDNTGFSTGDHCHMGFKECDKNGDGLNLNNGWYGNLNYEPLFENRYIVDVDENIAEMKLTLKDLRKKLLKLLEIQVIKLVESVKGRL